MAPLPLRDELAIDRTLLANERTLLAYLRSAVALLLAGITMIHFSLHSWFWAAGLACLPAGVLCGVIGVVRYMKTRRVLLDIRAQAVESPCGLDECSGEER